MSTVVAHDFNAVRIARVYKAAMQRTTFTTAIVRSGTKGRREVISRAGHHEPNAFARQVESLSGGKVVAVRHERVTTTGRRRHTVAVFSMESH